MSIDSKSVVLISFNRGCVVKHKIMSYVILIQLAVITAIGLRLLLSSPHLL